MKWVFKHVSVRMFVHLVLIGLGLAVLLGWIIVTSSRQPVTAPKPESPVRANQLFAPDNAPFSRQPQAHLIHKVDTKQPVVFLTMDDGQHKDERAVEFLKRRQWPVSLFITDEYAGDNYEYFKKMAQNGAMVQNHTLNHPYFARLPYDEQKSEICAASSKVVEVFGRRPTLLRPPGGHYNYNTLDSSYACGIDAVIMWSAKVDGGAMQFQRGNSLVPGDIVLMHFRPKIMEDLAAFEAEIMKEGLYVARLEDWIRISR